MNLNNAGTSEMMSELRVTWGPNVKILLQVMLVGVWAMAQSVVPLGIISSEEALLPCIIAVFITSVWCLASWSFRQDSRFMPYGIFLFVSILFNAGRALAILIEPSRIDNIFPGFDFNSSTLVQTYGFVGLGLSCFHLGALLYVRRYRSPHPASMPLAHLRNSKALIKVGVAMVLTSIGPWLYITSQQIQRVSLYGYGIGQFELNERTTGLGSAPGILAGFFVPGILFLLAGGCKRKMTIGLSLVLVLIYAALGYISGSRGPATAALVSYVWVWHVLVRPIAWPRIGLTACLGILILPLVSATRELPFQERLRPSAIVQAYSWLGNPIIYLFDETGWSASTIANTVELVPSVRPYDLGTSYAYAVLNIVPNVFGGEHPVNRHGLLSDWLVVTLAPEYASRGGGWGFSFIGEAYLNFGPIGGAVALLIIGWAICGLLSSTAGSNSPAGVALAACFLAGILLLARGESAPTVRSLIWYGLFPYWASTIIANQSWAFRIPEVMKE
jgi:oligosaccharide repeat unit polymerase